MRQPTQQHSRFRNRNGNSSLLFAWTKVEISSPRIATMIHSKVEICQLFCLVLKSLHHEQLAILVEAKQLVELGAIFLTLEWQLVATQLSSQQHEHLHQPVYIHHYIHTEHSVGSNSIYTTTNKQNWTHISTYNLPSCKRRLSSSTMTSSIRPRCEQYTE